jgi:hypothetical protein
LFGCPKTKISIDREEERKKIKKKEKKKRRNYINPAADSRVFITLKTEKELKSFFFFASHIHSSLDIVE